MSNNKRRFWLPLIGLLLAYIVATVCNVGSLIDPMGEKPAIEITMTMIYIAAWILFFIFFQSKSKAMYIICLVYWTSLLVSAAIDILELIDVPVDKYIPMEMPLVIIPMMAPMMGLFAADVVINNEMIFFGLCFLICVVFTVLSIIKLKKRNST